MIPQPIFPLRKGRIARVLIALLWGAYGFFPVWSQSREAFSEFQLGKPLFDITVLPRLIYDGEKVRCDAVLEISYNNLRFVRTGSGFQGEIEVTALVKNREGVQVWREVKREGVTVSSYDQTTERNLFLTIVLSFYLAPGDYLLQVLLTDLESRDSYRAEERFSLGLTSLPFDLSVPLLSRSSFWDTLRSLPGDIAFRGLRPDSSGRIWIFCDLLTRQGLLPESLYVEVTNRAGRSYLQRGLKLADIVKDAYLVFPVEFSSIPHGESVVKVRVGREGETVTRESRLWISHYGLPSFIRDLDEAIRQLKYVATQEEIDKLLATFTLQREEAFFQFWNQNFPTPGEGINGKMLEYYSRIAYANQHFSSSRPGWETDRGRIYVIYGEPSVIERSGAEVGGGTLEIWYYHHLGKRFIFRDEFGFGDYRLISPAW